MGHGMYGSSAVPPDDGLEPLPPSLSRTRGNTETMRPEWTGVDATIHVRRLEAEVERLRTALAEIRDADPVEMALDPNWPARIAEEALR